jgi:hypothetical protein
LRSFLVPALLAELTAGLASALYLSDAISSSPLRILVVEQKKFLPKCPDYFECAPAGYILLGIIWHN